MSVWTIEQPLHRPFNYDQENVEQLKKIAENTEITAKSRREF